MKTNQTFLEGDNVIVHSLGNMHLDKEYRAIIRGVSINHGVNPATIYILEAIDKPDPDYPYSHYTMPEACLRRDASMEKETHNIIMGSPRPGRFAFEGNHHIFDFVEHCYWVRESQAGVWAKGKL